MIQCSSRRVRGLRIVRCTEPDTHVITGKWHHCKKTSHVWLVRDGERGEPRFYPWPGGTYMMGRFSVPWWFFNIAPDWMHDYADKFGGVVAVPIDDSEVHLPVYYVLVRLWKKHWWSVRTYYVLEIRDELNKMMGMTQSIDKKKIEEDARDYIILSRDLPDDAKFRVEVMFVRSV